MTKPDAGAKYDEFAASRLRRLQHVLLLRLYPYWSGYVDAPVGQPIPPCYWRTERFWDGYAWRVRRVRICG
jgi:hypothetical protein